MTALDDTSGRAGSTGRAAAAGPAAADARMHIGEFAERTGMSHRTIRHYDDVGLLQPSARTEGGFRLYTERDVDEMLVIRRMKPLGYSLDEMAQLLDVFRTLRDRTADPSVHERIEVFAADALSRRARLAQHLAWADEFLGLLGALAPDAGGAPGSGGGGRTDPGHGGAAST